MHRLAGALHQAFAGREALVTSPQGRFLEGAALLNGRLVEGADAYGKHLFVHFAGEQVLNVHLGLIGSFDVLAHIGTPPAPAGAVRVRMVNAQTYADLRGATLVQVISPEQVEATIARLGPDPLRVGTPGNDPQRSLARLARTARPVAECLMDQSIIAGVGNVYRAEVLFRHRIDPFVPGNKLKARSWLAMWDDLVALLPYGVAFGQIITLDSQLQEAAQVLAGREPTAYDPSWGGIMPGERGGFVRGAGGRGPTAAPDLAGGLDAAAPERSFAGFEREYYVYKRDGQPCRVCGSRVRTKLLAGRNLFWCGRCQRRH